MKTSLVVRAPVVRASRTEVLQRSLRFPDNFEVREGESIEEIQHKRRIKKEMCIRKSELLPRREHKCGKETR